MIVLQISKRNKKKLGKFPELFLFNDKNLNLKLVPNPQNYEAWTIVIPHRFGKIVADKFSLVFGEASFVSCIDDEVRQSRFCTHLIADSESVPCIFFEIIPCVFFCKVVGSHRPYENP